MSTQPRHIAFLVSENGLPAQNLNHTQLPQAFRAAGWVVTRTAHGNLSCDNGGLLVDGVASETFDLIWPVGFGDSPTFADRLQLWTQAACPLINAPASYALHHGKAIWLDLAPQTFISEQTVDLEAYRRRYGGDWILKPLAGSHGNGVVHITADAAIPDIKGYNMLQRFEPAIAAGEHRSLLVGERIIGTYRREPTNDHRANLAHAGRAIAAELSDDETQLVHEVAARLADAGIRFAAIDTAYPFLVEVNIANPGGFNTLATIYRRSFATDLVEATEAWLLKGERLAAL